MSFLELVVDNFKKSKHAVLYDNVHVLNFDDLCSEDLIAFKKNQGKNRTCLLLLAAEAHYFDPGSNISRQWIQFKDALLKHQIFNCDFFVTSVFFHPDFDKSLEYLNKNHFDWSFLKFEIDLMYLYDIDPIKKNIDKLRDNTTKLFLDECHMKFSHLNFTHRMHRQLFSKFLIRENLVRDNLVAINTDAVDYLDEDEIKRRITTEENRLIARGDVKQDWFYNKHLLDLWRDVPLVYHRHPDIDEFNKNGNTNGQTNLTFLHKASFNIVSETVFDYPAPFCTEKTAQSLMSKRPFIMIGPCGNMQHLRDRGFKTFHTIIDESYDKIEDPNKRLEAIMRLVLEINKKSQKELNDMVYEVKDTLIHNYSLMLEKIMNFTNITESRIIKT